jgi:hypothetical protein
MVEQSVGRALDLFGVETGIARWGEGIAPVSGDD